MTKKHKDWIWAYLFIAPTVVGLYLFFLYPMVNSVYISLTKWNNLTKPVFIGLANYARMFNDPQVFRDFTNTIFFVITSVPLTIVVSLLLANSLNRKSKLTGIFRTVFFLPYIMLPVASAMIWLIMFNSRYGLINSLLGILQLPQPGWLADQWLVRIVIIFVGLWASVGYYAIIILSGLQNIPRQYYEASEMEGSGGFHTFVYITVPLVTPQLFFSAIIAVITVFKMFDYIYIFGKGNAFVLESTRTMAYGIYERGFTFQEMGYASAEAVLLCVFVLIVTVIQNIGQKKWVHYSA